MKKQNDKKNKGIRNKLPMIYSIALAFLVSFMFFSGIVISDDGNIWTKNDNTIVQVNPENNTLLGRDDTTTYKLEIDGTTYIHDILYVNDSVVFSPTTGSHSIGYSIFFDMLIYGDDNGHVFSGGDGSSAVLFDFATDVGECIITPYDTVYLGSNTFGFKEAHIIDLYVTDDLFVSDRTVHNGDTNTYHDYNSDQEIVVVGGVEFYRITEGTTDTMIFNNGRNNVDHDYNSDQEIVVIGGVEFYRATEGTTDTMIFNNGRNNVDYDFNTDNEYDTFKIDSSTDSAGFNSGMFRSSDIYSADTSIDTGESMIFAGHGVNDIVMSLPELSQDGQIYTFTNVDSNIVTVDGYNNQHINGELNINLTQLYDSVTLVSNKKLFSWLIISDTR